MIVAVLGFALVIFLGWLAFGVSCIVAELRAMQQSTRAGMRGISDAVYHGHDKIAREVMDVGAVLAQAARQDAEQDAQDNLYRGIFGS